MKRLASYSNCQGGAVLHFLKKTPLAKEFSMEQWNNWQLCLAEQSGAEFLKALPLADVLLLQPTGEFACTDGSTMPCSDKLIADYVRPDCIRITWPFCFNHGFFPVLKVAPGFDGFITGEEVRSKVLLYRWGSLEWEILHDYDRDCYNFDCARRFVECLAEQARREESCDIKMVPWILREYRNRRLFLTQNHPTSELFVELTKRILGQLLAGVNALRENETWGMYKPSDPSTPIAGLIRSLGDPIPILDENEANLPGTLPVHPAVVRELGLKYSPSADVSYYRTLVEEMIKEAAK